MYTDREEFEGWMERIMERFDRTEKLLERVLKKNNTLDGEEVLERIMTQKWISNFLVNATVPSGCCRTSPSAARCSTARRTCTSSSAPVSPTWRNGLRNARRRKPGKRKGAGKGGCSRENDIFLTVLLVDEALPDREIRQGYCFVIREVSLSLFARRQKAVLSGTVAVVT
mgnify:CR=1 FL=1